MTLSRDDKERRWQADQLDPDNWLRIPEFDVLPREVVFEGFQFPLVHPAAKNFEQMEKLRVQLRRARQLAKRSYSKLAALKEAYIDVLDAFELGGTATTLKEADAARYMIFIQEVEALSRNEDSAVLAAGIEKLEADLVEWVKPTSDWFDQRESQAGAATAELFKKIRRS